MSNFKRCSWSEEEIAYLKKHYSRLSVAQISERLRRSAKGVRNKAESIGLRKRKGPAPRRVNWVESEIEILRNNVYCGIEKLRKMLPRHTGPAIKAKRHKLRLVIPRESRSISGGYPCRWGRKNGKKQVIFLHREVYEKHIGRKLKKSEHIHHINMDKQDYRIENLFLCRDASHHRIIHGGFNTIVSELMGRGVIRFDREREEYFICENWKKQNKN
ncbi:MAG: HNH endonuclease [Flavobacteriales bacterium]